MMTTKKKANGHTIEIVHPEKYLYKKERVSKSEVLNYYERIADHMLFHVLGRPISMKRFPDGIDEEGFYQKEVPDYFPKWIKTAHVPVKEEKKSQKQVLIHSRATLLYLANQAAIGIHIWLSRHDKLDTPDRMIFDFDPSKITKKSFKEIVEAARMLKRILKDVGLTPFVMTTGSRGLHVVVPIKREKSFDEVRAIAKAIAETVEKRYPDLYTTETKKNKRKGKIFIDYLRNAYGQTSIAPYSLRPRRGAPIATPLDWAELGRIKGSTHYTIENIFKRLSQKEGPWKYINEHAGSLDEAETVFLE